MEALKLRAKIHSNATVEWLQPLPTLPEGEVEVILLYEKNDADTESEKNVSELPALNGIRFLKDCLRREDIYNDDGR